MSARRSSLILAVLATLAIAAVTPSITPVGAHVRPMRAWPQDAQAMARTATAGWLASVPAPSRIGAEPPGRCRRFARRAVACPIAIVVLVHGAERRRPWRCSATAVVSRRGDRLTARRTDTHCAPLPGQTR
jgi:hypothetical protein